MGYSTDWPLSRRAPSPLRQWALPVPHEGPLLVGVLGNGGGRKGHEGGGRLSGLEVQP